MNKQRRKEMAEALKLLQDAHLILESVADEEREYFDNMPEGLQGSDKGQAASEAADALEEARDNVSGAVERLEGIE